MSYYNSKDEIISEIFGSATSFGIKAKYHSDKAGYYFELKMNGIENAIAQPSRWQGSNSGGANGFVKDITYNFPCSLVVKNAAM